MRETSLPTMKSGFKKYFTEAMIEMGIKPGPYYRKVGLPVKDPEDLDSLIPLRPIYRLANRVAIEENIPNFGSLVVKLKPWHKAETLGPLIAQSSTIGDLLNTFCKVVAGQRALADFRVTTDGETVWFGYHGPNIIKNDVQMELYRLTGMMQLVQLGAGSGWRPERVEVRMPGCDIHNACRWTKQCNVTFSSVDSRITLPRIVLKLPVNIDIPETSFPKNSAFDINDNFIDTLKQIIPIYLGQRPCKIEIIARITELRIRTLQRLLRAHGTSFTELLGQVRFELAQFKLAQKSFSTAEISAYLGYSDSAHFIRAFRRWSGLTPSEYRKSVSRK